MNDLPAIRRYQVYQCHAPSGGISAVDETQYETVEEARGAAEALTSEVSEFTICRVGDTDYAYPAYWAQPIDELGMPILGGVEDV